jgi:SEC-C motif
MMMALVVLSPEQVGEGSIPDAMPSSEAQAERMVDAKEGAEPVKRGVKTGADCGIPRVSLGTRRRRSTNHHRERLCLATAAWRQFQPLGTQRNAVIEVGPEEPRRGTTAPMHEPAEHFLRRLDRLAGPEVELALGLYRDPGLLRSVLGALPLPESAERVAISLDDAARGPFLIVTRDGHFVTCLGRGMKPGEHPVVSRGQLDALSAKVDSLRERLALAMRVDSNRERACAKLLSRLFIGSDRVSREDFLAVSAWEPMLAPAFVEMFPRMTHALVEQAAVLRNLRTKNRNIERAMHEYWKLLHATSHVALLSTMGGDREHYEELTKEVPLSRAAFSWGLTSTGISAFVLKGAWTAGRLGKLLLPAYKNALVEDVALFELFDTLFALLAIGRRTSGLRTEIAKAILAAPSTATTPHAKRLREQVGHEIETVCQAAAAMVSEDSDDLLQQKVVEYGSQVLGEAVEDLSDVDRIDLCRLVTVTQYTDGLTDGRKLLATMSLISATARGEPEQFYVPKRWLDMVYTPWQPSYTERILEPMKLGERASRKTIVRDPVPGPNQPCSCGSGRKFKKCCGRVGS